MSIRLSVDDRHAGMARHQGGPQPTAKVSEGQKGGEWPYPPMAWLEWEEYPPHPGEGLRKEMTAFLNLGDIDHLLEVLTQLRAELVAAQEKYDATPQPEDAK